REGYVHIVTRVLRGLLDAGATAQNDHVSKRQLLPAGLRAVELLLDSLKGLQHSLQLGRLVDFPILLRRNTDARPVGSATLVGATERGRRRPGGRDQFRDR